MWCREGYLLGRRHGTVHSQNEGMNDEGADEVCLEHFITHLAVLEGKERGGRERVEEKG